MACFQKAAYETVDLVVAHLLVGYRSQEAELSTPSLPGLLSPQLPWLNRANPDSRRMRAVACHAPENEVFLRDKCTVNTGSLRDEPRRKSAENLSFLTE